MKPTIKGVYVEHVVKYSFHMHTKTVKVLMWQGHENGELFYDPEYAIRSAKKEMNKVKKRKLILIMRKILAKLRFN